MEHNVFPLILDSCQKSELTIRVDEFWIDFDGFVLGAGGVIKLLLLLVDAPEFVPRDCIFWINLNGFEEISFRVRPLLFLRIAETLFISVPRILWRRSRRGAERKPLDISETTQVNDSDVRVVECLPECQHDRTRLEASQVG